MKKLALVALPWSVVDRPSAALASLAPYVREHCPDWTVDCHYAYLGVAMDIGIPLYRVLAEDAMHLGENIYAGLYYPERRDVVRAELARALGQFSFPLADTLYYPDEVYGASRTYATVAEQIFVILERHLASLLETLGEGYDMVGFTTCFGQLFGNLLLTSRIKERSPKTLTLLGGSSISAAVGPSIMTEYAFVDYIIQGEGERPLVALLEKLERKDETEPRGVLSKANLANSQGGVASWEVANMDALPLPDYSGYAEFADAASIPWLVPIEGSRGCWWDRGKQTGNPRDTCYFCNLNVQWDGYRQKSLDRVIREIDELSSRYANPLLFFLDNILRTKGIEELSQKVRQQGKNYVIFYEMRAQISPYDILCLWEMGLRSAQFGIEGLSNSYLKRVGKGTSVIQNLQAMKTCYELNIDHSGANLVVDFPGSTDLEVEETRDAITRYAILYEPLRLSSFGIGLGSTVERLKDSFGVSNLRNADFWRVGLPEDVYSRLELLDRSGDFPHADWRPVRRAVGLWRRAQQTARASSYRHLLSYLDGGDYLKIIDLRSRTPRILRFDSWERAVYLSAMEIARHSDLVQRHTDGSVPEVSRLDRWLHDLTRDSLMYREGTRYLALAPATFPDFAARRIRAAHETKARSHEGRQTVTGYLPNGSSGPPVGPTGLVPPATSSSS
jgi:ribosomal peptide maturation radical SAM protein 1